MFGMSPEEISALGTLAQAVLALAALIGSVAISAYVWYGTRRIAQLEYERAIREAWIAVDTTALSSDAMLVMADNLMDPRNGNDDIEKRRRRWFAYTVLNAVTSLYFGSKYRLTQVEMEACKELLRPMLLHDEVFEITQGHGYGAEFGAFCRKIREEQMKALAEASANSGSQAPSASSSTAANGSAAQPG